MSEGRSYLVISVVVFTVALVVRLVPLYWSPLPATLDGFDYARLAAIVAETGHYPLDGLQADRFVFSGLLTTAALVFGEQPLGFAQWFVAVIGAATCLIPIALGREFGRGLDWKPRRVQHAATLAGLALALDGIYARRTGVPDEELLAYVLVPLLALALYRTLDRRRVAWPIVTVVLLLVFPLTHIFSTLIAALTVTGVAAAYLPGNRRRRPWMLGLGLVGGFWVYFVTYYGLAARSGILTVAYVDRILAHPSVFLAWIIVLVVGVAWWFRADTVWQRVVFLLPIGGGLLIVAVNAFTAVFPGTPQSPPVVLGLILFYAIPAGFAGVAVPRTTDHPPIGIPITALLAAPFVNSYFSLTATLTPEFFDTVVRTQTFAHLPVMVLAAFGVAAVGTDGLRVRSIPERAATSLRVIVVLVFVGTIVVTTPLAHINLDTGSAPSTTLRSEYTAAQFVGDHVEGPVATDHTFSRLGRVVVGSKRVLGPTRRWLAGGAPPACPMLSQRSWSRSGAHFYPAAPKTISRERYETALAERRVVYSASGLDPATLSLPPDDTPAGC